MDSTTENILSPKTYATHTFMHFLPSVSHLSSLAKTLKPKFQNQNQKQTTTTKNLTLLFFAKTLQPF
jgi:hypothetical protein